MWETCTGWVLVREGLLGAIFYHQIFTKYYNSISGFIPWLSPTSWTLNFPHWYLTLSLPWSCQDKPTAVPQSGEGEISSMRRENFSPWNRKGDGKISWRWFDSLDILSNHLSDCTDNLWPSWGSTKERQRCKAELGGLGRYFGLLSLGFFRVWFGFEELKLPGLYCSVTLARPLSGVISHISITRWVYLVFIWIYKKTTK